MKKVLLILLIGVISILGNDFNCAVQAKILPPLNYSSNYNINDEGKTELEKSLMQVVYKFRYADTIMITNINNYITLLNVQVDPSFSNTEASNVFIDVLGPNAKGLTNKDFSRLLYMIFYQTKNKAQLSKKIAEFTEAQKKQYLAIAYNIELASFLYDSAIIDMNELINNNYSALSESNSGVQGYTAIVSCLKSDKQLSNAIYKNIAVLANNNGLHLVRASENSNVPKNSNNLYNQDSSIKITSSVVTARELDAQLQYFNLSTTGNPNNWSQSDLNTVWGVKGKLYSLKGDYAEALKCYNKAIELNQANGTFFEGRGFVKWSLADFSGSISDYDKAISLGATKADNYFNRACSKVLLGQNDSAINDFKTVYQKTQNTKDTGLGVLSMTYSKALSDGDGGFIKNKIFLDNPLMLKKYMNKTGTMPVNLEGKSKEAQDDASKKAMEMLNQATKVQPKSVIPVGCRVYMIIGRLKDSHTEVRYTTIAQINKIEDIVNADPRFEWVKYMTVPDSYLDRYPRY